MIKRTSSRNSRTRGFRVKNVLQICLLLGVCFWLIYQVKHSHDKKKEFDEKEAKISIRAQNGDGISNLGRKGLHPHDQELPKDDKHKEDDDEETMLEEEVKKMEENKHEKEQVEDETNHEEEEGERSKHDVEEREEEEEETNKHEDEEQEEETKSDETEDERTGGGDDEIDERDQEKIGETDHEEDFVDEEKEREEEGEEQEGGNDEAGDKEDYETSMEDQDHHRGMQNDHEAREEQYKADDASSAVTHDAQTISTEPERVSLENSGTNDLELEKNSNYSNSDSVNWDKKPSTLQLGEGITADSNPSPNVTAGEKNNDEIINSEDQSTKSGTSFSVSNYQSRLSNKSMDVNTGAGNETSVSPQHNETVVTSDSNQAQNAKIDNSSTGEASNLKTTELEQINSNAVADSRKIDSDSAVLDKTENIDDGAKDSNSSTNSEPDRLEMFIKPAVEAEAEVKTDGSDKVIRPEVKDDAKVNSGSSTTSEETADAAKDENSNVKNELGRTDGTEIVVHDHIDSSNASVGHESKEAPIHLPGNSKDGVSSQYAAAE